MCLILANSYPLPSFLFSSVFSTRSLHLILACSCLAPSLIFSSLLRISVWSILAFPLMPPVYFLPFPPLLTLPLSPHFFLSFIFFYFLPVFFSFSLFLASFHFLPTLAKSVFVLSSPLFTSFLCSTLHFFLVFFSFPSFSLYHSTFPFSHPKVSFPSRLFHTYFLTFHLFLLTHFLLTVLSSIPLLFQYNFNSFHVLIFSLLFLYLFFSF